MSEENKVIEINGVKFEVDARTATLRQVSKVQIGSKVKVLLDGDDTVYYGVVIGFEPFADAPVVIVAYMNKGSYYSTAEIKFLYYSSKSKAKVIISHENDDYALEKESVVKNLDGAIAKKELELQELRDKKEYFLKNFKVYWQPLEAPQTT